jgi:CubicO group peptidase (beta-lactamase class C family)
VRDGAVSVHVAGTRRVDSDLPVEADTIFDAASLSKPMVAYAVLQLVDGGALALDDRMVGFVPPLDRTNPACDRITVRHILNHTCGLPNLRTREEPRVHFEPGSRFSYSSVGFRWLQSALEAATGEGLEATMRRLVLAPLGLAHSSFQWHARYAVAAATPHEDGVPQPKHEPPEASASYSLQTTAADYGAFLAACLAGRGLREATWSAWLQPAVRVPLGDAIALDEPAAELEEGVAWGLGWGLEPAGGTFFQWGKMTGVRSFAMGSVARRAGVVLLTNANTGLRLMPAVTAEVLPGAHPAHAWLQACVTE